MGITHENKQGSWRRARISINEPENRQEFVRLMNNNAAFISKTIELPGDKEPRLGE